MRVPLTLLAALVIAGCAGFSPDGAVGPVRDAAKQHLKQDLAWPRSETDRAALDARVAELLREPLGADAAVQIALFNHRGLAASLHELGIAEADLVQASRLPNPGFSFGRFKAGDEREIERGFHFSLARVIALPWRRDAARQRLEATQRQLAMQVLDHGMATRRAWVQAVAAAEGVRYARQVMQAAEASAELARRMQQVGNFSALQRAREQAFYADAALGVARAEQAERAARERLARLMGLWGTQTAYRLPERLPDLPHQARDLADAERTAVAQRLDLQAARATARQLAAERGVTRADTLAGGVELGLERNSSNEGPTSRGWELGFEIPLFDGGARRAAADHAWRQAVLRAEQAAIDARSEVREAYGAYRSAYDIAKHHREEIVPLRRRILDENVLRYNGMLIGVFELLADARLQIASVNAAIEAQRDFWLADADLDLALVGKPMLTPMSNPAATPAAGGGDAH
ncbi:MAG TPA: TolC family protein [Burkholderiaceae bacterium]|nr:TolC family protein [Burkholderiaceae bacterium]